MSGDEGQRIDGVILKYSGALPLTFLVQPISCISGMPLVICNPEVAHEY
jgi:hypothetical protein